MKRRNIPHGYYGAFFDLGGVLVKVNLDQFKQELASRTRCTTEQIDMAIFNNNLKGQFDQGLISREEFCLRAVNCMQADLNPAIFGEMWSDMFEEITPNVNILRLINRRMPVYAATNIDPLHLAALNDRFRWMKLFSGIAASCLLGVCKPTPEFLIQALDKFKLNPADCLFIDDKMENVESAGQMGMTAIYAPNHRTLALTLESLDLI